MKSELTDFWNFLIELDVKSGNFQPASIFSQFRSTNEGMILDFFNYLHTHNIIRIGEDFNNSEMPFMTFTKFGRTLKGNDKRRIAIFEQFLEIYNTD